MWHVTCDTWQVVSKCIIYTPCKYKNIWLGSKLSISSKSTSFLLKLHLHCNLPNFRYVLNISATVGVQTNTWPMCCQIFCWVCVGKDWKSLSQTLQRWILSLSVSHCFHPATTWIPQQTRPWHLQIQVPADERRFSCAAWSWTLSWR